MVDESSKIQHSSIRESTEIACKTSTRIYLPLFFQVKPHQMNRFFCSFLFCYFFACLLPAQIVNIEDKRRSITDSIGWYERADLNFNWIKNTQAIVNLSGSFQLEFQHHNRRVLSITNMQFVKAGQTSFVNQGFQHLRYNINYSSWYTHEFFGQLQYNENLQIKLRGLLGSGGRFRLTGSSKQSAYLGLAYMFEYDEEAGEAIRHDHRMSSYLSLRLQLAPNTVLASTSYFQPLLSDFKDFRLSSNTTLIVKINAKISFTNSLALLYDSRAPADVPAFSHNMRSGIRYEF